VTDLGPPPDERQPEPGKGSVESGAEDTSARIIDPPDDHVIEGSRHGEREPVSPGPAPANGAKDTDDATDLAPGAAASTDPVLPDNTAVPDDTAAADVESVLTPHVAVGSERSTVVERAQNPGPLFWLTLTLGWAVIAFGVHGLISNWS
jgi:hypothetical protein